MEYRMVYVLRRDIYQKEPHIKCPNHLKNYQKERKKVMSKQFSIFFIYINI